MIDRSRAVSLLMNWARWAERWWYDIPGQPGIGCFGTGYNTWGAQTHQKYLAAMAVLAAESAVGESDRRWALSRAMASLRFMLGSHVTGPRACTDGTKWGHTWISALGIERMMHGVHALAPHLNDEDRANLRRVLESESDWLLTSYCRGPHSGIQADKWGDSGKNDPESNIWNGALLWRTATAYPDHPNAAAWQERALRFLAAGVSIDADAADETVYDGKPLKDRYAGSSFFNSFSLDHHAYFNVGYMVICASNAAMLHFDQRATNRRTPELLHLHQRELWNAIRPLIFTDGRLCRIGGDSRVRYAYCQEYLIPSLLYAADHLGDAGALALVNGALSFYEKEAAANEDGSFYGKRLTPLQSVNPYYYVRLEGDRANALSMLLAYLPHVSTLATTPTVGQTDWIDTEYGAALHRSPTRIASFAWRAYGIGQGMCISPDASDMAEWEQNLAGEITFVDGNKDASHPNRLTRRKLLRHYVTQFDGGFITSGAIAEGMNVHLAEGWQGNHLATHYLAFVALPDDRTVVGLQVCRVGGARALLRAVKGMKLNVPNDLFNEGQRRMQHASNDTLLRGPWSVGVNELRSSWVTLDHKLSAIGLYGAPTIAISRSNLQRGGSVPNLVVDEVCFGHRAGTPWMADAGSILLDCGWMVGAGVDATAAAELSAANADARIETENPVIRIAEVRDANGRKHRIVFNVGETDQAIDGITLKSAEARLM